MTHNNFQIRRVDITNEVKNQVRELENTIPRIGEILNSICDFLKYNAHKGIAVGYTEMYCYETLAIDGIPSLECLYTFTNSEVRLSELYLKDEN